MMTAASAHTHRLTRFELPVGQGLAVPDSGLLHGPLIASANRTTTRLLVGRNAGVGAATHLSAAALIDRADQRPQIGHRLQGQSTVFFPGSNPYRVKICSTCCPVTATPRATKRDATMDADTKTSAL